MIYVVLKRIIDIFGSLLLLPFFLVIFIFVSIAIKIDDRGPIFYKGERIGKNNKVFKMYKFRTMKVNSDLIVNKDGSTFNSENDQRVTRVGKFLREKSIDELPQILNVLVGNMSFVGPRASLKEALGTFLDDETDKMKVKPGITGYTQAYYRNGITNREKRIKDSWYANNFGFILDLKILFKTIIMVFSKKNLYTNDSQIPNGDK